MVELFDKIIQDGRTSFVPRSNKTRAFWTKHNARVASSQNAARETVTIVPATEEEMKALRVEVVPSSKPVVAVDNKEEINELKQALAKQQELISKLLEQQAVPMDNEPAKEKGKPGPKPKNVTNGEGE